MIMTREDLLAMHVLALAVAFFWVALVLIRPVKETEKNDDESPAMFI